MSDKLARPHREADYLALKGATRRLVEACGGVESAAAATRTGFQALSKYGRPQEPFFAPIDVVADLEADAGVPLVTRALAALCGHVLVPLPRPETGTGRWYRHISEVAQDAGAVVARLGAALADDGEVSRAEARALALREHVRHAIKELAALDLALERLEKGDGDAA
ncbi:phage regulatory CII family protein [Xanthobacter sp. YC-JY1]|uniref:phage regulatory CII family protein n=1 Tax=Xanthobacter sp. YC-JY1 TaxID=2419844 RepID=UPI001F314481|nr:phage regulatory CII family protein [Xanthobacter sp. YC-JY1]UJX46624.1 hypothetical protein D7006_19235 [Xanthobacter sp. YC-JY1]